MSVWWACHLPCRPILPSVELQTGFRREYHSGRSVVRGEMNHQRSIDRRMEDEFEVLPDARESSRRRANRLNVQSRASSENFLKCNTFRPYTMPHFYKPA